MNVIKLKVDFTNRIINQEGVYLVEGDYNSTKLVFEFDKDYEGTKIFEMAKPNTMQAIFVSEIIDNEVVLVAKDENENNVSIFTEAGKYIYEISLYDGDSKLTSISGTLPVAKEMVKIADAEVETYLPVFDQLMQELNTATEAANVAIEEANNLDIDVEKEDKVATVTITKKDGTTKSVEIYDGEGGGGGTGDYEELENKPSINGVELIGNKTTANLGLFSGNYNDLSNKPTIPIVPTDVSAFNNDADYQTGTDVSTAVGAETTNRQTADTALQSQIDALSNANDVVDVLATYQDLLDYDTTHLKNNDIIKVMTDSSHSNAISYFKWVITENVGAWSYVGSQGPFYTKSETDTLLNAKANTSDIPTELADLTEDSTHRIVTDTEKETWNGKQDDVEVISSSEPTLYTISTLVENKVYKLSEVSTIRINNTTVFDKETIIYFKSGASGTMIILPSAIINIGDNPTMILNSGFNSGTCTANKNYIISILNNIAVWKEY